MSTSAIVSDAIQRAGGQSAVARAFGVSQPSVWEWIQRGSVPAHRCLLLAEMAGIDVRTLRPDVFGKRNGNHGNHKR